MRALLLTASFPLFSRNGNQVRTYFFRFIEEALFAELFRAVDIFFATAAFDFEVVPALAFRLLFFPNQSGQPNQPSVLKILAGVAGMSSGFFALPLIPSRQYFSHSRLELTPYLRAYVLAFVNAR